MPEHILPVEPPLVFRETVEPRDRHRIFSLVNSSGYFLPREMAYGMDLFDEHLRKGDNSNYRFMLHEKDGDLIGVACFGQMRLTDRRYHLHWMAIDKAFHHHGLGRQMEEAIIKKVLLVGGVKIYAQTSNRDYHAAARAFYESRGYSPLAVIPDYYGDHDDMVMYVKDLMTKVADTAITACHDRKS